MCASTAVIIRDVTARDGFQSLKEIIPTANKVQIIEAIKQAGVHEIEVTSFVSPKAVPQMADSADLVRILPKDDVILSALVPNLTGAKRAAEVGIQELVVVISATDGHNLANIRRKVIESIEDLDAIFQVAEENKISVTGTVAVSFGCPYQGDVPVEDAFKIANAYISRGSKRVILADTTGMAVPTQVEEMVKNFRDTFPAIDLGLHFHNNRGTAMANLYTAFLSGASTFDTALGGIGGCPFVPKAAGNLPTEDVSYMLEEMGIRTDINLMSIIRAAKLLENLLGYTLPGQVMKSGPRDPALAAQTCSENM